GINTFVRTHLHSPDMPIILLTGDDDETQALKAVQMGAQDYLIKGEINGKHLVRSVLYSMRRNQLKLEEQVQYFHRSEARFQIIIEGNADGIVIVDAEGVVLYVNPAAEVLFGRNENELKGEVLGFPLVTGNKTQINIFQKSGESIVVEMRIVEVNWEGKPALLASLRDITEHKKTEEALYSLSISDDLTGLHNRRGSMNLAERYIRSIQGTRKRFLMAFFDLDGLKEINDAFGHNQGSQAIMETAEILRETFRTSDILSRFGGDEFVVLAKDISEDGEGIILERLQSNIEAHNVKSERPYKLSISVGIACYDPQDPISIDELLRRADESMYSNKRRKKSRGSQGVFL
ncbi:MAG: diguanylate cyclase, partial [Thermodesulfobacteriota bacterium]